MEFAEFHNALRVLLNTDNPLGRDAATRLAEVARLAECHRANAETNYEKWAAAEARIAELEAEVGRLRTAFRVNMLRLSPGVSHAEIDALLNAK